LAGRQPEGGGVSLLLVGAGGHARAVAEVLAAGNSPVDAYVDPRPSNWLKARHLRSDAEAEALDAQGYVIGIGGMTPEQLSNRLALFRTYRARNWTPRTVIHASAVISEDSEIGEGCIVLARVVIQPAVRLGEAVIVNTGAIVEHDSSVADGTHVAPGAIVLGGCKVGASCMIGAGALVLPGAEVPDGTLVPAGGRYPK
jgi:sugar O-acyltransferase (sialic acid O-acetyltransferase NeuD family)